jgi:hypothetical protein
MVHRGFAYIGHMVSQGFSWSMCATRKIPNVNYVAAPPGTWNVHLQAHDDLLLVINARDLFADARFADEKVYYTRSVGETVSDVQDKGWSAGLRMFDISTPGSRVKSLSVAERHRYSPHLVRRRALGVCFRADRRFYRLHLPDHRSGRSA